MTDREQPSEAAEILKERRSGMEARARIADYRLLAPVSLRSRYVTLTDALIHRLEGHDGWVPEVVVCLDKSGRPVAWLVRALWSALARVPGTRFEDGDVPPLPQFRMVNIDREQWWEQTGASETGVVDVGRVPKQRFDSLRVVFQPAGATTTDGSWLDGRRVLVVDEVYNTGDTLRIAQGLFQRAFPDAEVRGYHWMTPGIKVDRCWQSAHRGGPRLVPGRHMGRSTGREPDGPG